MYDVSSNCVLTRRSFSSEERENVAAREWAVVLPTADSRAATLSLPRNKERRIAG